MSLFKKPNRVAELQEKSQSILDVFSRTITDLTEVNFEIDTVSAEKEAEKAKLEADLNLLKTRKEDNAKVITKINKIFE